MANSRLRTYAEFATAPIMANSRLRTYAEFATAPKVQMMSEAEQLRFVMILCIRCNSDVTLQNEWRPN